MLTDSQTVTGTSLPPPPTGHPEPRFSAGDEAGGGGPDGATAGVRRHGNTYCPPAAEDPLRWLGGRVRPVGGLRVARPVPSGLVSTVGVPAAATCCQHG